MDTCDAEIKYELDNWIINGAVINAGTASETLVEKAWGLASVSPQVKMRIDTVIDIASVTKVLATTTALAICNTDGLIDFDIPFTVYLPEYAALLPEPITVRDLAMHFSGFGQQNHYNAPEGNEIRRKMLTVPPPVRPHEKFEYSCWNFQLLGMLVDVTGKLLPDFCRERIFIPLEMHSTSLGSPWTTDPDLLAQTCATEKPGQISDFIAFRLYRDGFTAGNAGAFSNAPDMGKFCRCLLRGGEYAPGKRLFSDYAFDAMTVPRLSDGGVKRSLGWAVADEYKPSGFSPRTIYHSGWSGQTVFLDPDRQFYAVVLTTRLLNEYDRAKKGRSKLIGELGKIAAPSVNSF